MKPLFQKRHFEVIAKVLQKLPYDGNKTASEFVRLFRADNPNFDENKFWRAVNEK